MHHYQKKRIRIIIEPIRFSIAAVIHTKGKVLSGICPKTNIYPESILECSFKIAENGYIPQAVVITPVKELPGIVNHIETNTNVILDAFNNTNNVTNKEGIAVVREQIQELQSKVIEQETTIHQLFNLMQQSETNLKEEIHTLRQRVESSTLSNVLTMPINETNSCNQIDQILTPAVLSQDNEIDWLSLLNETISCVPNIPQSYGSETIPPFDANLTLSEEIVSYDRENMLQSDHI